MTMQAPAVAPSTPFLLGTRKILEEVTTKTFTLGGGVVDVELERVGYADGLLIELRGTVTGANATLVYKGAGAYNAISRIVVDPPGQADLISVSGWGLKLAELAGRDIVTQRHGGDYGAAPSGLQANSFAAAQLVDLLPGAVGANIWRAFYFVPFHRNSRDPRGLVGLGHRGERTRLRLYPSTIADLVTTPANLSAQSLEVRVSQLYYTAPPVGVAQPDATWAIVIEEQKQAIAGVGTQRVDIDPEGIILGIYQTVILNDLPNTADVESVTLSLNRDKVVDAVPMAPYLWVANKGRFAQWPLGVVPFDLDMHAADPAFLGADGHERGRGWLYSDTLDDLFTELKIASGATLGSVAQVQTVVKRLVKIG